MAAIVSIPSQTMCLYSQYIYQCRSTTPSAGDLHFVCPTFKSAEGSSFQHRCYVVCISSFPGAGDVWFSLNGTTYQNNSIVVLEKISEDDSALLCMTNLTSCCRASDTEDVRFALGNWFFPNGTRVPSGDVNWDFVRTRSHMAVHMNRRRGGVEGIYRCVIPDALNVTQTIYIGVYSTKTGEWSTGP